MKQEVNTTEKNAALIKPARLVGVQDNDGYHLCAGFIKEFDKDGKVVFEDEGKRVMSYGAYEIAIQDLENCLSHAKAMRDLKIAQRGEEATDSAKTVDAVQ